MRLKEIFPWLISFWNDVPLLNHFLNHFLSSLAVICPNIYFLKGSPLIIRVWWSVIRRKLDLDVVWYNSDMDCPNIWILKSMPRFLNHWKVCPLINQRLEVWPKSTILGMFCPWSIGSSYALPMIIRFFPWLEGYLGDFPLVKSVLIRFTFDQTIVKISSMLSINLWVKLFLLKSNSNAMLMQILKEKIITKNKYVWWMIFGHVVGTNEGVKTIWFNKHLESI